MTEDRKTIIGRADFVEFLDYAGLIVPAKIDTGAYRSSVHASDIQIEIIEGRKVLAFTLLKGHPNAKKGIRVKKKFFKKTFVQNSFGVKEERFVVRLKVKVAGRECSTHFTLANRVNNVYPVLLGRKLLRYYLVDSSVDQTDRIELKKNLFAFLGSPYEADDEDNEEVSE